MRTIHGCTPSWVYGHAVAALWVFPETEANRSTFSSVMIDSTVCHRATRRTLLSEIRRTAAKNGGAPLRKGRFLADTGIRESDWVGRYWARWGDALHEAGFTASGLQAARSDVAMLEALVGLVRELQRVPVRGELALKRPSDVSFQSPNTFERFGDRSQLIARLRQFSAERGYADVEHICALAATASHGNEGEDAAELPPDLGFVYLLKSGKFYKIGRSNAVGRRERELAIQLPEKSAVVHSIKTDDPAGIEDYWHRRFDSRRQNGEWFALTGTDVAAFKRRRFM